MRYIVGIDLGTTNSTLSYIDREREYAVPEVFSIPQLLEEGLVKRSSSLPSFCYIAEEGEFRAKALDLPWKSAMRYAVGAFALKQGGKVPTGLVASAKSWLCYRTAGTKEAPLPVDARDDAMRISAVEASRRYLEHIREAWNYAVAKGNYDEELEQQEIILAVPASFDEVARALTAEAAKGAGFHKIAFLEEPQAAFYNWISENRKRWHESFESGDAILVCDVGGGTTDFSLIRFVKEGGLASFERLAVGDHLLLGGDNIDTALASLIEEKIVASYGRELAGEQWKKALHEARRAKEALFGGEETFRLSIQGEGSSVVRGTLSVELSREEVTKRLLDGFFPILPFEEATLLKRAKGLRSSGLPYEEDPAITKQLAHFIKSACREEADLPRFLLFNGGTMMAKPFQEAIVACYNSWFPAIGVQVLQAKSVEHAVSKGAAYYGLQRGGEKTLIKAGSPRSYYLELDVAGGGMGKSEKKALCLLPRGADEGAQYRSKERFSAIANRAVQFTLYASHTRLGDLPGDLVAVDPKELHKLPPIATLLRFGKKGSFTDEREIAVEISAEYTPIGTLEIGLAAAETEHRWRLEFQLKASSGGENQLSFISGGRRDETESTPFLEGAKGALIGLFSPGGAIPPHDIVKIVEERLGSERSSWSPSTLRELFSALFKQAQYRKLSPKHEARWWNLAGFLLRPGFGFPLDDHRVSDLWKLLLGEMQEKLPDEVALQKCICIRRIAGGLSKGQQQQLYHQLLPNIYNKKSGKIEQPKGQERYQFLERVRTLAALERLDFKAKKCLGSALVESVKKRKSEIGDEMTAIARIAAREPLYASYASALPAEEVVKWVEALLPLAKGEKEALSLALMVQRTKHNALNVDSSLREKVKKLSHSTHLHHMVDGSETLSEREQSQLFGDSLPPGIILRMD